MTDPNIASLEKIQKSTNHIQWAARNVSEATKVKKAIAGERHTRPSSLYAQGLVEIADRAHAKPPVPPPTPDPPKPQPPKPSDTGYAPQSYNQGSRGQNAKFNVHINCTLRGDGYYVDKNGIVYQDNGLCSSGGRTEPFIPELKPSDMSDGKEPWEAYEWMGNIIGPGPENYPAVCYAK
jgi:hypothetical protein